MKKVTVLLQQDEQTGEGEQGSEGNRRAGDDGMPRNATIIWDEDTRAVFGSMMAETMKQMGVDGQTHAKHHQVLDEIIPFIKILQTQAAEKAAFFKKLRESVLDLVIKGLSVAFVVAIVAIVFGMAGAFEFVRKLLGVAG